MMGYGGSWGIFSKFFSQYPRTSLSITRPRSRSPHPAIAARRLRCQRVCAVTTMLMCLRFLFFTAAAPPFGLSDHFLVALIRRAVSRVARVVAIETAPRILTDHLVIDAPAARGPVISRTENIQLNHTFYFFFRRIWALLCGRSRSRRTMTSSSTSCWRLIWHFLSAFLKR